MKHSASAPAQIPRADLFIEPPVAIPGREIELAGRFVEPSGASRRIWFRFRADQAPRLTARADPFVRALLVHAMGRVRRVLVHGTVSPGLLDNVAEFQAAFAAFQGWPAGHVVEFAATETAEPAYRSGRADGITAFSGGVDSCFSVFRHTALSPLVPKRPIRAALFMHGFDIPLEDAGAFAGAAAACADLAQEAGLKLFTGSTNLRTLPVPWESTFATAAAASLSFFQPAYAFGLVPSFHDYAHTDLEHGSNPVTDPLLSSPAFQVIHDGSRFGRIDKLEHLSQWPGALRRLRVCWQGRHLDRNCCRCEKCIRTMLMLRVCGVREAEAFPLPVAPADVERLVIGSRAGLDELTYLLEEAERRGMREPWMPGLVRAIRRNTRYQRLRKWARSFRAMKASRLHRLLRPAARRFFGQEREAAVPAPADAESVDAR